jgi:hypothetical protein
MAIMKDTLSQMGFNYQDLNESGIMIKDAKIRHGAVTITPETVRYDDMDEKIVNQIKQTYSVNFYRDRAIREGMQLKQEAQADGEIVLTLTH